MIFVVNRKWGRVNQELIHVWSSFPPLLKSFHGNNLLPKLGCSWSLLRFDVQSESRADKGCKRSSLTFSGSFVDDLSYWSFFSFVSFLLLAFFLFWLKLKSWFRALSYITHQAFCYIILVLITCPRVSVRRFKKTPLFFFL